MLRAPYPERRPGPGDPCDVRFQGPIVEVYSLCEDCRYRVEHRVQTRVLSPLDAVRIRESEEKEGGTQTREQWSPWLVSGSLINEPRGNVIASVGEVAMFFSLSNFTTVNRAALFAARVAVGAAVRSGHGGIWGVSDPLCHPPRPGPGPCREGSLTPQMHVAIVRQNRALSLPSPNAPLVSDAEST